MRWVGHVACAGDTKNAYIILVVKTGRNRTLAIHRHRRKDNIKIDLKETGREDVDWIIFTLYGVKCPLDERLLASEEGLCSMELVALCAR
jgi:hypothetical protein